MLSSARAGVGPALTRVTPRDGSPPTAARSAAEECGDGSTLSRPLVIKMLHAHLAREPEMRERFRREAEAAAQLVHPYICSIIDYGTAGNGSGRFWGIDKNTAGTLSLLGD